MIAASIASIDEPFSSTSALPAIVRDLHAFARRVAGQIIVRSPVVTPGAARGEAVHELVVRGFIRVRSPIAILRPPRRALVPDVAARKNDHARRA